MGLDIEQVFDYTVAAVLPQSRSALPLLVPPNMPAPGVYVHEGARRVAADFLGALCPALCAGLSVYWVDGGNSFDANGLSYRARQLGHAPLEVLRRVKLARAFNLFQLETMVCQKLPALWRGEPVVLSDPFPLFYDDSVPWPVAKGVFERTLAGIKRLPAVWLVLSSGVGPPQGREGLVERL